MARILLIDDDAHFRKSLRGLLTESGFEVDEAADGAEGIKRYRQRASEIVVVDMFMPEKEGIETVRELRARFPGVKIIAMSGGGGQFGSPEVLSIARMLGADRILRKPFEFSELLESIAGLLKPD